MKHDLYSTGDTVFDLTISSPSFHDGRYRRYRARCNRCERSFTPHRTDVERGVTRSCGCQRGRHERKINPEQRGHSNTRVYAAFLKMRQRCEFRTDYIAKNITICREWESFTAFRLWSEQNGYGDDLTLDRIDNALGYSPENCRWVSSAVQTRNRAATKLTTETALALRIAHYYGNERLIDLSRRFGLTGDASVNYVVKGSTWRDVVHFPDARQHGVDRRPVEPSADALAIARATPDAAKYRRALSAYSQSECSGRADG